MVRKNVEIMLIFVGLVLFVQMVDAKAFEHPGGLHSGSQLEETRKYIADGEQCRTSAFRALIAEADGNLDRAPHAMSNFNVPGYYENADAHREAMDNLSADAWAAYACAIAYQLSEQGEKSKYAVKACEILNAWAGKNRKTSNVDGDLAMADAGIGLVLAAELMTDCSSWSTKDRSIFKKWVGRVYLKSCDKIVDEPNNWGDWGLLGCIAAHYFLDDASAVDRDIKDLRKKIDKSIEEDGHMPEETKREKRGIWYTYFSLAPLTAACQVAENAREAGLFQYKGRDDAGIEEALDYLLKYCHEPQAWPHYKGSDLNKPKPNKYPGNLYEAMSGIYGKAAYEDWINYSRPIMIYGHHYAWAVPTLLRPAAVSKSN